MGAIRVAIVAESRLFSDGLCQILRGDSSLLITTDNRSVADADAHVRLVDGRVPSAMPLDAVRLRRDTPPYTIVVNAPDADAWAAGSELVLAHLVRRAGADAGPLESDVATILRVEDDAITEIVTVSSRALDAYWSSAT